MNIERICVGLPRTVEIDGESVRTSIFKSPVSESVAVSKQNIAGDRQADLTVHGGRDKAIYVYSTDYHQVWAGELGVGTLEDSQFGENLSVTGCTDEQVVIGSRYRLGDVEVTVTQPRIPCFKLGIRLNDRTFPQRFWAAGRLGFYARVDTEGSIAQGQAVELVDKPGHGISIRSLYDIVTSGRAEDARFALDTLVDLDDGWLRRLHRRAQTGPS